MKVGAILVGLLLVASLPLAVAAADNPKVTLDTQGTSISQALADLSKQSGIQILCDKELTGTISGSFYSMDLEKLLDAVTKSNELKWQKLYMPVKADQKPTLEQVKARAAAIAAVTGDTVVVYDPATGKQKVFVTQDSSAPSVDPEKLGLKPVYLVTKPSTEVAKDERVKDTASKFQSIQEERMRLLTQMTPEQRTQALQQEMLYMMQLDPSTRQQMMLAQMNARRNMDPQTRDAYRQIQRETMRSLREQGLMPEWQGRGGPGGGGGGRNHNHQDNGGGGGQ